MTSAAELDDYAREVKLRGWRGVFPSDQMPDDIRPGDCLIANYSPLHDGVRNGTHWVALAFPRGAHARYFDSMGRGPEVWDGTLGVDSPFKTYLRRHSFAPKGMPHRYSWNRVQWQSRQTEVCGEWCLLWLMSGCDTTRDPWPGFSRVNFAKNDARVRAMIGLRAGPSPHRPPSVGSAG